MTYVEGFGPNPSSHLRGFFGLVPNTRTTNTLTVIIDPSAIKKLVIPSTEREFEYLSLALHGFMDSINENDIMAWIVPEVHYNDVKHKMNSGKLKQRVLISDKDLESHTYDHLLGQYGSSPSDVKLYIKDLDKNHYYKEARINHLKYILNDFKDINWTLDAIELEDHILSWYEKNKNDIKWNEDLYQYVIKEQ